MFVREQTRPVRVGNLTIGGQSSVVIQSMTNTDTRDVVSTVQQIAALTKAGCQLVRVAVLDEQAAQAIKEIKANIEIPLVADIHFNYKLAILAIENGADKIRINPGNIGTQQQVAQIVAAAKNHDVAIRVGVNAGSLEKELLAKYQHPCPEALVESALRNIAIIEELDYHNIIVSLKASDVLMTLRASQQFAIKSNIAQHIGITEAGTVWQGSIKSATGLGAILTSGIGDTIRVSLTGDPVQEIKVAKTILQTLKLSPLGAELIACPTCGRCQIGLEELALQVEKMLENVQHPCKIAVMGCAVNGPGEAREADIGIAGGIGEGLIFRKGKIIKKVPEEQLLSEFQKELVQFLANQKKGVV